MRHKFDRRPPLNEQIEVMVTTDFKRLTLEAAARRNKSASEFVREAISMALTQAA